MPQRDWRYPQRSEARLQGEVPLFLGAHLGKGPGRRELTPVDRVYAIGDVHGRFDLFRDLVELIRQDQAVLPPAFTRIILSGDIVDRGPDSARMIRGRMALTKVSDRFMVLKGNHEEMMERSLRGDLETFEHWLSLGGEQTLLSFGVDPALLQELVTSETLRFAVEAVGEDVIRWLERLPLTHFHDGFLFVHAGIRPGIPIHKQRSEDLLWIRRDFLDDDSTHGVIVVHGHTVVEGGPVIRHNRIGIDTGAYRTGRLTALGIESGKTWILSTALEPNAHDELANYQALWRESMARASGRVSQEQVGTDE
ncbi:metallophosphoesterase family protein [Sphingomonas aerophila]|uniref:Serine/threonine protein phosphatase 1 n=1 Tax=Sphingomonas aerophila TaxID=1344948 RepID=A0A7W9BGV0_9SPHN|nr:metallophosphoesterase family protein [Sphingomonas aerophila]MBB5716898.1 serine/threonine protein phosphatase 1 [Sphingomonas aerophila]